MSIRMNIIKLRDIFGITQEQLAKIAGVSRGAVSQWEGGFSEPRMGSIQNIADYFDLTKSNIIEDGGMDLIDPITHKPKPFPIQGAIRVVPEDMVEVPVLARVHAGKFTDPDDLSEKLDQVTIPRFLVDSDPDTYALESEGDCMNLVYPEGCTIVVSPNKEPINGSVVVAKIDGNDAIMREMFRTPDTLVLSPRSSNPEHKDIVIRTEDGHTVELVGKVVWFQARQEMK